MVAWFLITVLLACLAVTPVSAAPTRQLCLSCHSSHYSELGICTACHRGNPASERKNIAHQRLITGRYARFTLAADPLLQDGIRLLEQFACRRCHVIGGKGNRLSVNLDHATARRLPEELALSIRQPVQNMPDFGVGEAQLTAIVNGLLSEASHQAGVPAKRPQIVHFDQTTDVGKDVFSIKCGPCHRLLSVRLGGLGRGDVGPNLSGLLTPFYPKSYRNAERWDDKGLQRWLGNPRLIRPDARMQPVKLSEMEFRDLLEILRVTNQE